MRRQHGWFLVHGSELKYITKFGVWWCVTGRKVGPERVVLVILQLWMSTALNRTGPARQWASLTKSSARCFGTQPPRPPLPSRQPTIETFSETSRPRPYYANHPRFRELPRPKVYCPLCLTHVLLFDLFKSLGGLSLSELWLLGVPHGQRLLSTFRMMKNCLAQCLEV